MNKDTVIDLRKKVIFFKNILKQHGYFYDVNQLHTFFKYFQSYSPVVVKDYWEDFIEYSQNKPVIRNIDFYIHIPFCRSKCNYCLFPSWLSKDRRQIDQYVDYLVENMRFFSKTFRQIKFRNLYIGGGTPSILSERQLNKVLTNLFQYFSFCKNSQKTSEGNPHSTKGSKFNLLRRYGFNRVSFGVQTLNIKALKINKRDYQQREEIKRAILLAKKAGFRDINIDLIVGLAGDTLDHFERTFSEMAKLKPYNIVVYGLMPPSDTYLSDYLKMSRESYFTEYYPKMISQAIRIMNSLSRKFGYIPDSLDRARFHWGFRHKDHIDSYASKTYSGEYAGCTFGLGTFSRSHIHGLLEYRQIKQPSHFEPTIEIYEGRKLNTKEEMVRFIINQIDQKSKIPRKMFQTIFRARLINVFPYAIQALKQLKKIRITNDYINFSFRQPEEKYIYALFFFDNRIINKNGEHQS